nr:RHS repeat-associated core domain-containing protein [[Clostridium] methoxybenzovorans]
MGSTIFLLNQEQEIRKSYHYDPFGSIIETSGSIENRITYTGQMYDGISGQYYLRARFYNPKIGRFMQEDAYRGDGLNLYAYCQNNPITYYDPSGYLGLCPAGKNNPQAEQTKSTSKIYDENGNRIPYGFNSLEDYQKFVYELKKQLPEGTEIYFQGSSVTGVGHSSGLPFDYNRTSDFDIGLVNDDLFLQALDNGYRMKTDPNRIGPMNDKQLFNLGLSDAQKQLSNIVNRDVNFMLFESLSDAMKRPSLPVY